MKEIIERLISEVGLTEEQARHVIQTMKKFVIEKYPMLEGAVKNVFGED